MEYMKGAITDPWDIKIRVPNGTPDKKNGLKTAWAILHQHLIPGIVVALPNEALG